jgi:hypothetical protein
LPKATNRRKRHKTGTALSEVPARDAAQKIFLVLFLFLLWREGQNEDEEQDNLVATP